MVERPTPKCAMCDDTGFKDHAWLSTEPCNHVIPAPSPVKPDGEDFLSQLRRVNGARWAAWAQGDGEDPLYASNEFGGEAGEVQNEVKKLVREQRGWKGSRTTTEKLGDEIGDCIVCLDTIARAYGLDLAAVTAAKFNKTSAANGFVHQLEISLSPEPADGEPVAWMYSDGVRTHVMRHRTEEGEIFYGDDWSETPLFARAVTPSNPDRLVEAADRRTRQHIETLEHLSSQYLPGGPRDIKGAIRAAVAALSAAAEQNGGEG